MCPVEFRNSIKASGVFPRALMGLVLLVSWRDCLGKRANGVVVGPVLVSTSAISDPSKLHIRGLKNGKVLQDCSLESVALQFGVSDQFL